MKRMATVADVRALATDMLETMERAGQCWNMGQRSRCQTIIKMLHNMPSNAKVEVDHEDWAAMTFVPEKFRGE